MPNPPGGYQPDTKSESARRADFDLLRRIKQLERIVAVPGPGPGVGGSYVFNQGTPAASWVITHNLGYQPNVTVEDSSGTSVEGEIIYNSTNQLTLVFSAAFSGIAYLS